MSNPNRDADEFREVHKILASKYNDYVLHVLRFHSKAEAFQFNSRLSFISGMTLESMTYPSNILLVVVETSREVVNVIGGQLTSDQNSEVRRLAHEIGLKCESMSSAKPGSVTLQNFIQGTASTKGERNAGKKKWWQVFK